MKNKTYTTFDIVRILGMKRVTLQSWIDAGFIKPSFRSEEGRGPGLKSYFTLFQLYLIRLFQVLIFNGFSRKDAGKWVKILDEDERLKKSKGNKNEENFITIFRGKDTGFDVWLPSYLKTSSDPLDLGSYQLPTIQIGRMKYEDLRTEDYDLVLVINFAKIKKAVDFAIND